MSVSLGGKMTAHDDQEVDCLNVSLCLAEVSLHVQSFYYIENWDALFDFFFPLIPIINLTDEDCITKQMLALVEMRRQLEEQHTLQLSMLIAEQEKEQEKLRMVGRESTSFISLRFILQFDSYNIIFTKTIVKCWQLLFAFCNL